MNKQVAWSSKTRKRIFVGAVFMATGFLLMTTLAPRASAAPITAVDDAGPDDEPGQKDLSFLTVDYGLPGATTIDLDWGWDDTATSGNNTRDACALFDSDGDGFANFSMCVIVQTNGTTSRQLYSCGDTATDKCTNPRVAIASPLSTATSSIVTNSDPFRNDPAHVGNVCSATPGCLSNDTVADTTIALSEVGGANAFLLNVCSYPSGIPGSDPSDCVFTPNSGFLTIVKVADPDDTTDFRFDSSAASQAGDTEFHIAGSGSVQLISFAPTTTLDLNEVVPTGWNLDDASCELQTATPTATGTPTSTGVDNFTIQSGVETICTFNDSKEATITVTKVVNNDHGGTAAPDDFLLTLDGNAVTSGTAVTVDPGTYTAGETLLDGYTFDGFSGDCDDNGDITISAGENLTCTLTNSDKQATITVTKVVNNDHGGTAAPDDFLLTLDGNAVTSGTAIDVDPGTYTAGETLLDGYTFTGFSGDCDSNGDTTVALGENKTCTLTNDDIAQVNGQITPTGTTCNQFNTGTAADLDQLQYTVNKSGNIGSVSPGVFFYWIKLTNVAPGSNTFTINQAVTPSSYTHFFNQANGSFVFNSGCSKVAVQSITTSNGVTTVTFTAPANTDGTFIIGVKYDSNSVKNIAPPSGGSAQYDFSTAGVFGSTDSISLVPKF